MDRFKKFWWISNEKFTVMVEVDDKMNIIEAPPIVRKFIGQPIENLLSWAAKFPGFEYE